MLNIKYKKIVYIYTFLKYMILIYLFKSIYVKKNDNYIFYYITIIM